MENSFTHVTTWQAFIGNLEVGLASNEFWVGLAVVVIFAHSRFLITQIHFGRKGFPPLPPRAFTTRFRYWFAVTSYVALFGLFYVLFTTLGAIPEIQALLDAAGFPPPTHPMQENAAEAAPWVAPLETAESMDELTRGRGIYAWAATAFTAAIPPLIKRGDDRLRRTLFKFASIPHMARWTSEDLLRAVNADKAQAKTVWEKLAGTREALARLQRYEEYFDSDTVLRWRHNREHEIETALEGTPRKNAGSLLEEYAIFLSCATLSLEGTDYQARRMLNAALDVAGGRQVRNLQWNFSFNHLVAAILVILGLLLTGLVLAEAIQSLRPGGGGFTEMLKDLKKWFPGYLLAVPVYLLPLSFAAGMKMYLDDREYDRMRLPSPPEPMGIGMYLTIFLGAYLFGILPMVIYQTVVYHQIRVPTVLSYGLAPGLFGLTFVLVSHRRLIDGSTRLRQQIVRLVDGALHAIPVGLATLAAYYISYSPQRDQIADPASWYHHVIPAALIAFGLGWVECEMSRREDEERRKDEAHLREAADRLQDRSGNNLAAE